MESANSGYLLIEICKKIKSTNEPLSKIIKETKSNYQSNSTSVLCALRKQCDELSQGEALKIAMNEYTTMAETGAQLRRKHGILEFAFTSKKITTKEYKQCIGSMLDCLILQEKNDKTLDMYWLGPGLIAKDEKSISSLGTLQSALHFSQLHIKTNGDIVSTLELNSRPTPCPFSGGCETERTDNYPTACREKPWGRFTQSLPDELVCWYASGVKAFKNSNNIHIKRALHNSQISRFLCSARFLTI